MIASEKWNKVWYDMNDIECIYKYCCNAEKNKQKLVLELKIILKLITIERISIKGEVRDGSSIFQSKLESPMRVNW